MYKKVQNTAEISPDFDERRLTQATAELVCMSGGTIELTTLKRALYLAERASIRETLRPMLGGRYCSEPDSPTSADFIELLHSEEPSDSAGALWLRHFDLNDGQVTLRNPVSSKALSRGDRRRLKASFEALYSQPFQEAARLLETECPEWPQNRGKVYSLETILRGLDFEDESIRKILEDIRYESAVAARWGVPAG